MDSVLLQVIADARSKSAWALASRPSDKVSSDYVALLQAVASLPDPVPLLAGSAKPQAVAAKVEPALYLIQY